MTGGTRIVAVDTSLSHDEQDAPQTDTASEAPLALEEHWAEASEPEIPQRFSRSGLFFGLTAAFLVAGWTTLFALANLPELQTGGTVLQWTVWIRDWSVPILLIVVLWLVLMRNSRREAARFGETARLLSDESSRLETRLTTVNRELSLAREFLASQSRDLDAVGRMATERLSLHSETLASLIQDNSARLDTIGTVSTAALDNMEKLRGQLPVIASSAKDVTNNIANAGRTAHAQIEDMIQGFNRLNQFGRASEQQVVTLRKMVDETLGEFNQRSEHLGTIAAERFAALTATGDEFRAQLDQQEVHALAAVRTRAQALSDELAAARGVLDGHEAESLGSLRARLTAVRDESANVARSLRDGEGAAIEAWRKSVEKLEIDLRSAVERIADIDEQAMSSANARLEALTAEAEEIDNRMIERDRVFALEIDQRRTEFETRQAEFTQRLLDQIAGLDDAIAQRRAAHEEHARILAAHTENLAAQLADFSGQMQTIAAHGGEAESTVAASLTTLAEKLISSREALAGTDQEIAALTDGSVRLLELIQASVQHSRSDLPEAIAIGETRLAALEDRASAVQAVVETAHSQGAALAEHISTSNEGLTAARAQIEAMGSDLDGLAVAQTGALTELQESLADVREESNALADHAQGALSDAITALNSAAVAAVTGIEEMSATTVANLAGRLGEESGQAIDKAMRNRVAEVAGQLEQAAAHAAGVSREAAVQLRDQLAKVSELAGHLERRVAHARTRAEEQVDNDFARRAALITESLNSNAIDIARAIDTDVGDTAWAAYLKGDRGIFTRRAVKLLETPEAKAVAQLYESENGFRDNVSRYIHDFEAMLRQLLSTRDGHALGVTLLSSDMGKLYVALAQAIARLRN